jgi:hypothetical protein
MLHRNVLFTLAIGVLLVACSSAARAELGGYAFTSEFVRCVKAKSPDQDNHTTAGNSQSGLMNGEAVIGNLRANYWSYMNCISPSASGVAKASVPIATSCPGIDAVVNGHRIYTPPGVSGKRVRILGMSWVCVNGQWQSSSGSTPDWPGEQEDNGTHCKAGVVQKDACAFITPEMSHGTSKEVYGSYDGDRANIFAKGYGLASCDDGKVTLQNARCEVSECESGESVGWHARLSDSRLSCTGTVAHDGIAEHVNKESERKLFPTIALARLQTKILSGRATFACDQGRWRLKEESASTCSVKPAAELRCYAVHLLGGTKQYYCN